MGPAGPPQEPRFAYFSVQHPPPKATAARRGRRQRRQQVARLLGTKTNNR